MTNPYFQTFSLVAGEISRQFYGRTDLEKYGLGVAKAENFYVSMSGGMRSRPGLLFRDFLQHRSVFHQFRLGDGSENVLVVFGPGYIRLMQNGSYLLEDSTSISAVAANVITSAGHGLTVGDLCYVENAQLPSAVYVVTAVSGNNVTVEWLHGLIPAPAAAYTSGGTVAKVLTLTTPYTADELSSLYLHQNLSTLYVTVRGQSRHKLSFDASASTWSFDEIVSDTVLAAPSGVTLTASAAGSARIAVSVTAVDDRGIEGRPSVPVLITNSINYTVEEGSLKIAWSAVAGAVSYRVYRSVVVANDGLTTGQELGYIGDTKAPMFVDSNIVPDFTRTPPRNFNPFANGAVARIEVTAQGSGYTTGSVSVSGGTGFSGYPILQDGKVLGIVILNGGEGYELTDTVTISGAGTGATASITKVTELSGNDPAITYTFQQRQGYAGSTNAPLTIWGSKPEAPDNFDFSDIPNAADGYVITIAAQQLAPIRHVLPQRSGLLVMHSKGIERLAPDEGRALSGVNAAVDPEINIGVSALQPVTINNDVVFLAERGRSLISLNYTYYSNSYQPNDISVLAPHLLESPPTRLEFAGLPDNILWMPREDGRFLSVTYSREQEVYAWAQHATQGRVLDLCVIDYDRKGVVFFEVERFLNNRIVYTVEELSERRADLVEDYVGSDCSLLYSENIGGAATLTKAGTTFTASAPAFSSALVGDILRIGGGQYRITSVTSSTVVQTEELLPLTAVYPYTSRMIPTATWTLSRPVTTVGGLWHLEGQTVTILADAGVLASQVVTDGAVTLPKACTRVVVGLPYTCELVSLPASLITNSVQTDGRYKRITHVTVRLDETRGAEIGVLGNRIYPMKDKLSNNLAEQIATRSDIVKVQVDASFTRDAQIVIRQPYALPCSVLSFLLDAEVET